MLCHLNLSLASPLHDDCHINIGDRVDHEVPRLDTELIDFVAYCAVAIIFAIVNVVSIYVFLWMPFVWPDQSVARFMW